MPAVFLGHGSPMNTAAAADTTANVLVDGYDMGSMSMTAYGLGITCPQPTNEAHPAALPDPDVWPPDQTNV